MAEVPHIFLVQKVEHLSTNKKGNKRKNFILVKICTSKNLGLEIVSNFVLATYCVIEMQVIS